MFDEVRQGGGEIVDVDHVDPRAAIIAHGGFAAEELFEEMAAFRTVDA